MIIKYDGAMLNGAMEGQGRAEYDDGEVAVLLLLCVRSERLRTKNLAAKPKQPRDVV